MLLVIIFTLYECRSWDKFEDSYRIMHFSNGDNCWNGPDRSLTVLIFSYNNGVMCFFTSQNFYFFYQSCHVFAHIFGSMVNSWFTYPFQWPASHMLWSEPLISVIRGKVSKLGAWNQRALCYSGNARGLEFSVSKVSQMICHHYICCIHLLWLTMP